MLEPLDISSIILISSANISFLFIDKYFFSILIISLHFQVDSTYSLRLILMYNFDFDFHSIFIVSRKISKIDILNLTAKSVTLLWSYSAVQETPPDIISSEKCPFINEILLVNDNNAAISPLRINSTFSGKSTINLPNDIAEYQMM